MGFIYQWHTTVPYLPRLLYKLQGEVGLSQCPDAINQMGRKWEGGGLCSGPDANSSTTVGENIKLIFLKKLEKKID